MRLNPFLYYTKGERKAVLMLLILLALTFLFRWYIYPSASQAATCDTVACAKTDREFYARCESFRNNLIIEEREKKPKQQPRRELFTFDPNKVDSAVFIRLGLRPYVASNIRKYRDKGGVFKTKESFFRIYGMDSVQKQVLGPYIRIDSAQFIRQAVVDADSSGAYRVIKFTEKRVIEINSADSVTLKMIPGIGSYYASAIIGYRDRLGGFYDVSQLREIKSLPDTVFSKIQEWMEADTLQINMLDVNKLSVASLRRHPYLNFYQAKAIADIKREKGAISSFVELELLEEFSDTDFERLRYYVRF